MTRRPLPPKQSAALLASVPYDPDPLSVRDDELVERRRYPWDTPRLGRRDHEWCVPHDHVEPDAAKWERDQARELAKAARLARPSLLSRLVALVKGWLGR